jgi:hypothetical protein
MEKISHYDFINSVKSVAFGRFDYDLMEQLYDAAKIVNQLVDSDLPTIFLGLVQHRLVVMNPHLEDDKYQLDTVNALAEFLTHCWLKSTKDQYNWIVSALTWHAINSYDSLIGDGDEISLFPTDSDDDEF